jgi:type II secretory pathway pseudopilin PulG
MSTGAIIGIVIGVGVGVICVVGILASMLLPALARAKSKANRIKCVNNLSSIGRGTLGFSQDNNNRAPWQLTPSQRSNHFGTQDGTTAGHIFGLSAMKSELQTAKILVSPCDAARMADNERLQAGWSNIDTKGGNPVTYGSSYIFCQGGDFQRPASVVALTRNLSSDNIAAGYWSGADESPIPANAMTGLNRSQGQLVRADGSAMQSSEADLGTAGRVVKGHINARGGFSKGPSSTDVIR